MCEILLIDLFGLFMLLCKIYYHITMKRNISLIVGILIIFLSNHLFVNAQTCGVSAVYGGGPFYNNRTITIPEIKSSGFTTAVVWTIHIDASGNLNFNAEFPIVTNGQYTGHATWPNFPADIASLKVAPTSVNRVEFGLSASGSSTFLNIKNIIASQGTSSASILYKNFKALKDSIPAIDAMNFDDESTYDVNSSVQFSVMLADLGYKVTLCPYTSSTYWTSVAAQTNTQRPGTVDAVFLQCYAGGASNSPCSSTWNFSGIPVYPGLWDSNYTPSGVQTKMAGWKVQCSIKGGFMWLYDDFKNTSKTQQYASAINTALNVGVAGQAANVSPANAATNVGLPTSLNWNPGACTQSHDVYFGTTNPPALIGNQISATYNPGTLLPNTTYYWRIDEKNSVGTTTGVVWNFTTAIASSVEEDMGSGGIHISKNYPNPFNEQTNIDVDVLQPSTITISIVDVLGREVAVVAEGKVVTGHHTFVWKGENNKGQKMPSGLYMLLLSDRHAEGIHLVHADTILLQE